MDHSGLAPIMAASSTISKVLCMASSIQPGILIYIWTAVKIRKIGEYLSYEVFFNGQLPVGRISTSKKTILLVVMIATKHVHRVVRTIHHVNYHATKTA